MKEMTLEEFHAALKAQGVSSSLDYALRCPMCGTVQTARDLIDAGAGSTMEDVEPYLGFSCVGRWTGAGAPRSAGNGGPCNWTLGGLFQTHKLEVITPDGKRHPRFEPVSAAEAQSHMESRLKKVKSDGTMTVVACEWTDPDDGTCLAWGKNQKEAIAKARESGMGDVDTFRTVTYKINRSGSSLAHWLNNHFTRDNG